MVHTNRSRTAKSAQRQSPQRRATAKDQTSRPGSMYNPISTGRSLRIYSSSSSTNVIVDKADTNETIEVSIHAENFLQRCETLTISLRFR